MNNIELKILFKDINFRFLFLNMVLVLIGYASANTLGMGVFGTIKVVRTILLFISIGFVLSINGFSTVRILNSQSVYIIVFFIFIGSFFGSNSISSLYRGFTFVIPFLYVVYCINYLLKYGAFNLLKGLSLMIMLVYLIAPISYLLFGADLSNTLIYGATDEDAFASNHYGWSSVIFILSAFTVLKYYNLNLIFKYTIFLFLPFVFYLLMISANRSGMLSLAIAFFFFIIKDKYIKISYKLLISTIPLLILFFISLQESSVFKFLQQKNEQQLESGVEGRFDAFSIMLNYLELNPSTWFYGVGMFNYENLEKGGALLYGYHNSYFDVLFGVGSFIFLFFLFFMVIWPFKIFWKTTASYSLLIFPLMIIPFFESDLTAGQFLFFPWFAYMVLLNAKEFHPKFKNSIE